MLVMDRSMEVMGMRQDMIMATLTHTSKDIHTSILMLLTEDTTMETTVTTQKK